MKFKKLFIIISIFNILISFSGCDLGNLGGQDDIIPYVSSQDTSNEPTQQKDLDFTFSGNYNETIGKAEFQYPTGSGTTYGDLDELQRPTYAKARITKDLFEKEKLEKRESINVDPCGWPETNSKVEVTNIDGSVYRGYFWNRSHMIADSFGGKAIKENLITGTRGQNVGSRSNNGGMAYLETKIRKYFTDGNTGYVDYEVVNVYDNDELLPKYSICNAKSSDLKIDEKVVVYNSANGFDINYYDASIFK